MKNNLVNNYTGLEIAVIGMSGRFPKAGNVNEFWEKLIQGEELITFFSKEELLDKGLDLNQIDKKNFVGAQGIMEGVDNFDAAFFNYLPDEAMFMDPQIRIYHECVWQALEDAGYNVETYKGRIGLFSGASENLTWKAYSMLKALESTLSNFSIDQLSNKDFLSTLISYKLNLKGPSLNISTACSTSLVAVHTAVRSLLTGECEMALAGGISFSSNIKSGYFYEKGMINSSDGHCRTFDNESSGTVSGEGAGVVLLKKMKDAIRDNDNIYAVIRGSAINNDGIRKVGYTSPSVEGQIECIKLAHKLARIEPETITYIEAHGTATTLGDPIEIEALNAAFDNKTEKRCGIGSVKTNVGHLDVASGITGLIKVVLALKNKKIPKSLHFTTANKHIAFSNGPFYVVNELKKWENLNGLPLRAGVSSFGVGGTNAHMVLEEAPIFERSPTNNSHYLLTFSAATQKSLDANMLKMESFLINSKDSLVDIAYTLNNGRKHFPFRKSLVVSDLEQLKFKLIEKENNIFNSNNYNGEFNPVVFMFSDSSEYIEIGKKLYESYTFFANKINEGLEILKELSDGVDYKEILFKNDEKTNLQINQNSDILLFLVEYSLAECMINIGIAPQYIMGHGLGEHVAACVSGIINFKDALFMLYHRGILLNKLQVEYKLFAEISLTEAKCFLSNDITVSKAENSSYLIFSGAKEHIEILSAKFSELCISNMIKNASEGLNPLMADSILGEFEKICNNVRLFTPKYKIISNSGTVFTNQLSENIKHWCSQLLFPIPINKNAQKLILQGQSKIFIEFGEGVLLDILIKEIDDQSLIKKGLIMMSKNNNSYQCFIKAIESLWLLGKEIKWENHFEGVKARRISLPTYTFSENKFPSIVNPFSDLILSNTKEEKRNDVKNSFYQHSWTNIFLPKKEIKTKGIEHTYLLFSNENYMFNNIKELLIQNNIRFVEIICGKTYRRESENKYFLENQNQVDLQNLFEQLNHDNISYDRIVYGWDFSIDEQELSGKSFEDYNFKTTDSTNVLNLIKSLNYFLNNRDISIIYLTNNFHQVNRREKSNYKYAVSIGILKSFSLESENVRCTSVDIDAENIYGYDILNEFQQESKFNVAFRKGERWIENYHKINLDDTVPKNGLRNNGVYLITGALGQLGKILCEYLIHNYNATIVMIGRNELIQTFDWEVTTSDNSIADDIKFFYNLKKSGRKIEYITGDTTEFLTMQNIVKNIEENIGHINGIIYTDGLNYLKESYMTSVNIDWNFMLPHLKVKALPLMNIYKIFKNKNLDFLWTTSDLSTVLGQNGLGASMASNLLADSFVNSVDKKFNWKTVGIDGFNFQTDDNDLKISIDEFIEIFDRSLGLEHCSRFIISMTNLHDRMKSANKISTSHKEKAWDHSSEKGINRDKFYLNYTEPVTVTEKKLSNLWADFFGIDKIGKDDDFFTLGGDSLRSMTMIKKIFKEFNVDIPLIDFIEKGTLESIAAEIDMANNVRDIAEKTIDKNDAREIII